ncbi:MAG TPA: hypothetical protein VFP69_17280 [Streptomyces sp.]|nr:hypothetical protein [Streptomyces sp.]
MTPHQVLTVAVIGGATALLGLICLTGLAVIVYRTAARITDAADRRRDLATCRAIHALSNSRHPTEK